MKLGTTMRFVYRATLTAYAFVWMLLAIYGGEAAKTLFRFPRPAWQIIYGATAVVVAAAAWDGVFPWLRRYAAYMVVLAGLIRGASLVYRHFNQTSFGAPIVGGALWIVSALVTAAILVFGWVPLGPGRDG